ncbi:MAG TPA: hypothetical protein VFU88_14670 [Ktedonobacterales bacterium]|nr:hypothetical protein [Ktedonobacterales bacterium]
MRLAPRLADGKGQPGNAPSQEHIWAVEALPEAGTLGNIGLYPRTDQFFPTGAAIGKSLAIKVGDCPHRRHIPLLLKVVQWKVTDPTRFVTQYRPVRGTMAACKEFDRRALGWVKVEIEPAGATKARS